jgi:Fuc2NAc and GlcNAc transferase
VIGACVFAIALLGAYGCTGWLLHHSFIRTVVDQPNARSSHSLPTPRGGGLSIVAVTTCGVMILAADGAVSLRLAGPLVIGGLGVAAVGFRDDVRSVSVGVRMLTHVGAALLAACWLGGEGLADDGLALGFVGVVLRVLTVAWMLNLFNFMDGIDGLAASEGAFILLGGAALALVAGSSTPGPALIAGAACLGFLKWNWPRASIFMGDVGSGYLGYSIAVIALYSAQTGVVNLYAWTMLAALFLVDATLTLLRRLLLGRPIFQAHRTHAYQWLSRRWQSHVRVTKAAVGVNCLVLFPCAVACVKFPQAAPWICMTVLVLLGALGLALGSGRPE